METVKIRVKEGSPLPQYATQGAAGLDLVYNGTEPVRLQPLHREAFGTGIFAEIPEGYEIQIRPRSGLAAKHGVTVLNTPGTIDSDYRGEIKVILVNLSIEAYTINPGDRIAQMVPAQVVKADFETVKELGDTDRGAGGLGHTGK